VIFVQFSLFLAIGILLFVYYRDTGMAPPEKLDRIYPEFIWTQLPPVVAGVVIAAILAAAMANLSAALNSLASTTIVDFYKPFTALGQQRPESYYLKLGRAATIVWGAVLLGIGIMARQWGSVLEAGLTIASIPFGALLGVFLLGVLTKRVRETAAIVGMFAGLATIIYVRFATQIAWTWYVAIGAIATFSAAMLVSLFHSAPHEDTSI
jgi:Na+/proline symporter